MTVDPLTATMVIATTGATTGATAGATIGSELSMAAAALAAAGVASPRLEARLLLRHVLGVSMETLIGYPEQAVGEHDQAALRPLVARRAAREPLAYVLGEREFWSLPFRVTPDTLIPRPDSETLVEAALARIGDRNCELRILDLGTGSGCLLLALLSELPAAWGVGLDLSCAALDVARGNADALGLADRARWVQGNWGSAICGTFDLVVTNPPYVADAEFESLAPEVAQFEPRLALDGGSGGLECVRAIIPDLTRLAHPNSRHSLVICEIGAAQAPSVSTLLFDYGLRYIETINDLAGNPRCIAARLGPYEKKAWKPYNSRLLSQTARGCQVPPPMGASNGTNKPADIPPCQRLSAGRLGEIAGE